MIILAALFFVSCKDKTNVNDELTIKKQDTTLTLKSDSAVKEIVISEEPSNKCIEKSSLVLPYNQKIDPKKVSYNTLNCKISGIEEFQCGAPNLRYISLPKFENCEIILVPMDCGDFEYRYILLTIFQNKVVSNQYVEGEWNEPGDESYKEITNFKIDEEYTITITTNSVENNVTSQKSVVKLKIRDDGTFDKL